MSYECPRPKQNGSFFLSARIILLVAGASLAEMSPNIDATSYGGALAVRMCGY